MKNPKPLFTKGQQVRSTFRARWIGVIEGIEKFATYKGKRYPIYRVQPIFDAKGNPQPKSVKSRTMAESWLDKVY